MMSFKQGGSNLYVTLYYMVNQLKSTIFASNNNNIPYNRNTAQVEYKKKCDTSNNRDNWNHFKIIQKIPEQHTEKT
jgi:hypothetical protein